MSILDAHNAEDVLKLADDMERYARPSFEMQQAPAMLRVYAAILNGEIPYGWIEVGNSKIFTDIPAALMMEDGKIACTVNGSVMLPGTKLYVAREKKT